MSVKKGIIKYVAVWSVVVALAIGVLSVTSNETGNCPKRECNRMFCRMQSGVTLQGIYLGKYRSNFRKLKTDS